MIKVKKKKQRKPEKGLTYFTKNNERIDIIYYNEEKQVVLYRSMGRQYTKSLEAVKKMVYDYNRIDRP